MAVPGQKPETKDLEAMRLEYARNGRNAKKVAETFGIAHHSAYKYRDEYQWDAWADKLAARTEAKALERASDVNADALEAASIGIRKIKEAIESVHVHGTKLSDLAIALEKLHKVAALLTGGATDRPDYSSLTDTELLDEVQSLQEQVNAYLGRKAG